MYLTISSILVLITKCLSAPHIVIILADDLGWNDVSFHGSDQFQTPNIDALAYSGVILQDYYSQPICTPARAALLTGRHPISNGMQHDVIYAPQPWGLPLEDRLLPQYLRSEGYVSRAVGKWHLGFYKADYTPTRRGFDSHYGTWLGHQNHFTYMTDDNHPGYDLHRGLNVSWDGRNTFSADLFTREAESVIQDHDVSKPLFLYLSHTAPHAPLQAPRDAVDSVKHIAERKRRIYAAMVTKVDESVGKVMEAMKSKSMLNNTIILFLSDNGGATNNYNGNAASNWPLKGGKDTLWEGGVRSVGVIWSPLLKSTPRVHRGLVNVQDWLPTLLEAAGVGNQTLAHSQLDGVSQWSALNNQSDPPYTTMLHNIDPIRNIAAVRDGEWKLVVGRVHGGKYDGWFGRVTSNLQYNMSQVRSSLVGQAVQTTPFSVPDDSVVLRLRNEATVHCTKTRGKKSKKDKCRSMRAPCLFNILADPCEQKNMALRNPDVVTRLTHLLKGFHHVKPCNKPRDPRSYPNLWNGTWTTWGDFLSSNS
ncbi:arylsulfatase I-like [Macrosteles quadrilineatus]|uniref:arylsulfatase I-like n=1 Tax=Macrosteles quadrilineatus TaxID=74068 RepID=UPI0023E27D5A|nr:arylsulfatase I-like [Macrosteles quadrilineatus]